MGVAPAVDEPVVAEPVCAGEDPEDIPSVNALINALRAFVWLRAEKCVLGGPRHDPP
jgi:hypothetical protein